MKFKTGKIFLLILLGLVIVSGLQCNSAPDGFSAPFGSTVAITGADAVTLTSDGLFLINVAVTVDGSPGNGIFVIATCNNCTFYDKADGEDATIPVASRLQQVTSPYTFKTNGSGSYPLVIGLSAPSNLGVTSYEAVIGADIEVNSATAKITVSQGS